MELCRIQAVPEQQFSERRVTQPKARARLEKPLFTITVVVTTLCRLRGDSGVRSITLPTRAIPRVQVVVLIDLVSKLLRFLPLKTALYTQSLPSRIWQKT